MSTDLHGSALYEAATNSLASESSAENCWTKIVTSSFAMDLESFRKELRRVENLIKKEYGLKTMPGSWRSAKSVCLVASAAGIKMTNENGIIMGKSAAQLLIKGTKVALDPYDRVVGAIAILQKCLPECDTGEKEGAKSKLVEIMKC